MPSKAGAAPSVIEPIAKMLGMSGAGVVYNLVKGGMRGPYTDMDRALTVLEAKPKFARKVQLYRAKLKLPSKAQQPEPAAKADTVEEKKRKKPIRTKAVERERVRKIQAHWAKKLLRRLMAVLQKNTRGLSEKAARYRATKILQDGGYPGPRWDDEPRAVEIFKRAGIDMSKFEYENEISLGNGNALIPATPSEAQPPALRNGNGAHVIVTQPVLSETERWGLEALRHVRMSLEQWEHNHFSRAQKRLKNRFEPGDQMIVEALITSRTPPTSK